MSAERCSCLRIRCVKSGRMMKSSLTTVITMHEMHMAIVVVVASASAVMTVAEAPAAADAGSGELACVPRAGRRYPPTATTRCDGHLEDPLQ